MKIEIGESLAYSWLRHVKKCQIVQTNWKPSKQWDRKKIDFLPIFEEIKREFISSPLDIFKKSNIEQFFQQAEVDALGISRDSQKETHYFVDIAFHEAGLNYGSAEETISRVIKKFIRSYFIFLEYFISSSDAEFYFLSPRINVNTIYNPLIESLGKINKIFETRNLKPQFFVLANDDFNRSILCPTIEYSKNIADTNELFIRSSQLLNMFELSRNGNNSVRVKGKGYLPLQSLNINGEPNSNFPIPINTEGGKMDNKQLDRAIKSIGKACFVKYFEQFINKSISNIDLIEILKQEEGYTDTACQTRVTHSRRIINSGRAPEILRDISQSSKLDYAIANKANSLFNKYYS